MPAVVLESVHKLFRRTGLRIFGGECVETHALRDISFQVPAGEVLGLLGPNGSGKTTTLKLISTVLLPDQGSVWVNGVNTREAAHQVRRHVGFALASERSFFPRLTARENLDFFATLENVSRAERRDRIDRVLDTVGLSEHVNKQVMKFSTGMHQRLAIARALIKSPSVLLLDEPTRSLDPAAANHFWELLQDVAAGGMTIVLATHNFSEAAAVADRVAVLQKGVLLDCLPCHGVRIEQLQREYLELTGELAVPWLEHIPA